MAEPASDQTCRTRWACRCIDASGHERWLAIKANATRTLAGFACSHTWEWTPTQMVVLFSRKESACDELLKHSLTGLKKWVEEVDLDVWEVMIVLMDEVRRDERNGMIVLMDEVRRDERNG